MQQERIKDEQESNFGDEQQTKLEELEEECSEDEQKEDYQEGDVGKTDTWRTSLVLDDVQRDLTSYSLDNLYQDTSSKLLTIEICKNLGLLANEMYCDTWEHELMGWNRFAKAKDGFVWRCKKTGCGKKKSIRLGSFFEGSHLPIVTVFRFIYFWANDMVTQDFLIKELSIASGVVVNWKSYFRAVCAGHLFKHPAQLGGPGITVEVGHCMLVQKRKIHKRMVKEETWAFGGYEIESRKCFLQRITDRCAKTVLDVIKLHILPGTIIISDCWTEFGGIRNLPDDFMYLSKEHEIKFIDSIELAHSPNNRTPYQTSKRKRKNRLLSFKSLFDTYFVEFMWRYKFASSPLQAIVDHLREYYPLP